MPPFTRRPAPQQAAGRADSALLRAALDQALRLRDEEPTPRDAAAAADLIRQALRHSDEAGRRRLCDAVKSLTVLPHDIVLTLASDQHSVALPFIAHSPLLTDEDLVKLVWSGDASQRVTIAARPGLPAAVGSALIELAGARVVRSLLGNRSAEIDEASLQCCLSRFADDETVHEKLVERDRLPQSVSDALLGLLGPRLRQALLARHPVSPAAAQNARRQEGSQAPWWRAQVFSH